MFKKFFKKHSKKILAFIGVLTFTICGILGLTNIHASTLENTWLDIPISTYARGNSKLLSATFRIEYEVDDVTSTTNFSGVNIKVDFMSNYDVVLDFTSISGITKVDDIYYYNGYVINYVYFTNVWDYALNFNSYDDIYVYGFRSTSVLNTINDSSTNAPFINYAYYYQELIDTSSYYTYIYRYNMYNAFYNNNNNRVKFNFTIKSSYRSSLLNSELYNEDLDYLVIDNNNIQLLQNNDYSDFYNNNWVDEDTYNDLQDNYNSLQEDYNNLMNSASGGIFNYLTYLDDYGNRNMDYTKDDLINNGALVGSTLDYGVLFNLNPNITDNGNLLGSLKFGFTTPINLNMINLVIDTNINFTDNILITVYKMTSQGIVNPSIRYAIPISNDNLVEWNYVINYDNLQSIMTGTNLESFNAFSSILFGDGLTSTYFTENDYLKITSINTPYQIGYQTGYDNGVSYGVSSQQPTINTLNDNITNLTEQITENQLLINSLNEQVQSFSSDYNLNNLIWTIGGVPFESFKNIWNVNFFGINIADFILGLVTTFIGLYVLKKFFF